MPRRPTIIAYHLVWTAYGTWLPNDPRGSGSRRVATASLGTLGPRHYGRRRIQPDRRTVADFYDRAQPRLHFPVLRFDECQIRIVATAFADAIREHRYTCYACAILTDHVHLVIRLHRHRAERMIDHLQAASRSRLNGCGQAALDHPVWTLGGWRGFLSTPKRVRSAIAHVEQNPTKSGLVPQLWTFVAPFDGRPFRRASTTEHSQAALTGLAERMAPPREKNFESP